MSPLYSFHKFISPSYRKRGLVIVCFVMLGSLLDFFSLASFLPILMFIVQPEFISENIYINKLYHVFEFQSQNVFIISFVLAVLLFVIIKSLIGIFIARFKASYAYTIGSSISMQLLTRYLQMDYTNFLQLDFSRELNRISGHPMAFANNIILPITTLFSEALITLFIVAGVAYFDYRVLFLFSGILIPVLILFRMRRKTLKNIDHALKEKYPLLLKYAYQIVEGFPEIRMYAKEKFFKEKFQKTNQALVDTLIKDQTMQSGTTRLTEIIVGLIICSLIIYAIATQKPYQQTLLLLGLYAGASFRIIPSVNRIMLSLQQIRTHEYLLKELIVPFRQEAVPPKSKQTLMPFKETVELRNISFHYPDGSSLLKRISMTIRKGEMIAIIGKSGAGKTTLLLVLLRFLKETEGEILIDNQTIGDDQAWRRKIGYVPQHPYIIDGTVKENIAFGVPPQEVNEERIFQLIQYFELNSWVDQLSNGISTRLGEHGAKLSGGQRQRIALARALYADSEILLLDEVTNQVHHALELNILTLLAGLKAEGKTVIIVTHKLSAQSLYDSVYRLENGNLLEAVLT